MKWVSAEEYQEQLSPRLWRVVQVSFWVAFVPLVFFMPSALVGVMVAGLLAKQALMQPRFYPLLMGLSVLVLALGLWQIMAAWRTEGLTLSIVAVFVLLSVVKLMESRNARDIQVLFLLHLLLFLAVMMYDQSMLLFLYLLFSLGLSFWVLMKVLVREQTLANLLRWQMVLKILGLAFPFTVLLFFFVPRMSPMWGGLTQQSASITGLSGEMRMGDMASLAKSNEISFRAKFHGQSPKPQELYWRGPVLWHFDGNNWTQRQQDNYQKLNLEPDHSQVVEYSLLPVKEGVRWLTGLDVVLNPPRSVRFGGAGQMVIPEGSRQPAKYELRSALAYRMNGQSALGARERDDALHIPPSFAMPKTRAFAKALWEENGQTVEGFAQGFFNHVRQNEFYYTLEPSEGMGRVDEFLFGENGRVGFCEHYANAFTLAARSAGIPARVVTGYQGGTLNPMTGEWVVREENAHAWSELWIEGQGWVRYDPTAAVAPNRILQARLDSESLTGEDTRAFMSRWSERLATIAWLRNALDASQSFWQNWVIDLDRDQQRGLLEKLGLAKYGKMALVWLLVAGFVVVGLLLWAYYRLSAGRGEDKITRAARKMLKSMEKQGIIKRTSEPLNVFLRRLAAEASPERKALLLETAKCYEEERYLEQSKEAKLIDFLKRLS
ncbi:MAG: DUF3488 and transglutaminase-like domain-containing protein [Cardiobacteriaceae bacterium]|nr:DUF3488 and transglutaminase-like domain-containing protein [Cardiobacteriaceae bacterium]